MKAIMQDRYGPTTVLETREIDRPEIGNDQVLLRVLAAGVNPADWAITTGLPYIARPVYGLPRPKDRVRGTDVAGTVVAVGSDVAGFEAGDEVFGSATGSYAEFAAAAADGLAPKPANLTFAQAASAPIAGLVALQAMRDHGEVGPGQKVLVNGASGGIGTFAIQIAKALGAEVTGVASTRNLELVRSIGADHVIDYTREDFTRRGERYDVILDNVSKHSLSDLRRALTPTGILVPNGGRFDQRWFAGGGRVVTSRLLSRFVSQRLRPFLVSMNQADLRALGELMEAGKVTPVIDRTYPLNATPEAIRHVGEGHARGKVAIAVAPSPSLS